MNEFPFTLRNYQKLAIFDTYSLIRQSVKKILLFAPTGGGKTIISTRIVYDVVSRGRRVLFVVHRDILISQTFDKFSRLGIECGFFKAGWSENLSALVQIASVQTLPNRQEWKNLNFDVIIFDECHLVAFSKIAQQMMRVFFPKAIYIGLTATPWRLSRRESLGDIYSALVSTPMPKDLIKTGFLVKPSYHGLKFDISLDEIELSNGDYDTKQLNVVYDRPELIEQLYYTWCKLAWKRRSIAFAVGVKHAENIAAFFNENKVEAAVVTGKTPVSKRNKLYQKLANGELLVLASCGALSEGFDVPEVSCVMLARPTKSKALYFQQLGRGLRLSSEKRDCIVLDQAQNVLEHGFIEDLSEIKLVKSTDKLSKTRDSPPLKICPIESGGCGSYLHLSYLRCPNCEYNFDVEKLISVVGNQRILIDEDRERLSSYRDNLRKAYNNNYAPTWAAIKFKEKYSFFPPFDWARGAIFRHQKSQDLISLYQNYLIKIASRLDKDKGWIDKYLYLEFGHIK